MVMERQDLDGATVERLRAACQQEFPDNAVPCEGSNLKLDDDVMWLGFAKMRVLWGYPDPSICMAYCPEIFGENITLPYGQHFDDRAPADPAEEPLPIYPEEPQLTQQSTVGMQQRSAAPAVVSTKVAKEEIRRLLMGLPSDARKEARKKIKALRRDLIDDEE